MVAFLWLLEYVKIYVVDTVDLSCHFLLCCCCGNVCHQVITDMSTPALAKHGSDFLKRTYLQPTIMGELLPCLGVSEVGAGSDVAAIQTRAVKCGSDYVINGACSHLLMMILPI